MVDHDDAAFVDDGALPKVEWIEQINLGIACVKVHIAAKVNGSRLHDLKTTTDDLEFSAISRGAQVHLTCSVQHGVPTRLDCSQGQCILRCQGECATRFDVDQSDEVIAWFVQ